MRLASRVFGIGCTAGGVYVCAWCRRALMMVHAPVGSHITPTHTFRRGRRRVVPRLQLRQGRGGRARLLQEVHKVRGPLSAFHLKPFPLPPTNTLTDMPTNPTTQVGGGRGRGPLRPRPHARPARASAQPARRGPGLGRRGQRRQRRRQRGGADAADLILVGDMRWRSAPFGSVWKGREARTRSRVM